MYRFKLWAEYSRIWKDMGRIKEVPNPFMSLTTEKIGAMYALKISNQKFCTLPKKTHRERAGCSDDQTKIPKVKDLMHQRNIWGRNRAHCNSSKERHIREQLGLAGTQSLLEAFVCCH